jgi:8-oxo-dGTP diphosphatase
LKTINKGERMTELQPEQIYPKVGISIMVVKDGKVLLGKRKGSHGEGCWAFPGGSMEYMESIAETVHREIAEEVGIQVDNIRFIRIYNLREYEPKHFLDVAVKVDYVSGEPKVVEPDKCEGWEWFSPDELPEPLFATVKEIVESDKNGVNYIES